MRLRFAAIAAVALLLLATVGSAQTAAELLQKGIYTQQTAGNVDGAIEIYRQVIGLAGADRATAGRAQMQLVSAFLQKGDPAGASREFNMLVMTYGDQKEVVSSMSAAMRLAGSLRTAGPPAQRTPVPPTKGTLVNGLYHHTATGVEVRIPTDWSFSGDGPSSGGGEFVNFADPTGQIYFLWLMATSIPQSEVSAALDNDLQYKIHQRIVDGVQNFRIRPGTLLKRGWRTQAVSVAFDFGDGSQVEYDTFMHSEKTVVYLRTICPPTSIMSVQDRHQILLQGTTVP